MIDNELSSSKSGQSERFQKAFCVKIFVGRLNLAADIDSQHVASSKSGQRL